MEKVIKLFANCIPVKGAERSLICDLQRNSLNLIPNELFIILNKFENKTISEIKRAYKNEYDATIDEYLDFLINKEYIFLTNTPELFPKLDLSWHEPFSITNAIIDFDSKSIFNYKNILEQLEELNCKHIELRFFDVQPKKLNDILTFLKGSKSIIHSLDIVVSKKYHSYNFWVDLMRLYPRVQQIILHSSNQNKVNFPFKDQKRSILFIKGKLNSSIHCGVISHHTFAVNIKNFTESLKYNSCLNRKISIDVKGDIKNCPSMSRNFGNIENTTLQNALNHREFNKLWFITKDQINICRDCEFRYICTDCRAYVENPQDIYSKPLKCGYSPYTNKWEEWSKNPLKQKAIDFYDLKEIVLP